MNRTWVPLMDGDGKPLREILLTDVGGLTFKLDIPQHIFLEIHKQRFGRREQRAEAGA